jgi:hypothetical protein
MKMCKKCLEKNHINYYTLGLPKKDLCETCLNLTDTYEIKSKFIKKQCYKK